MVSALASSSVTFPRNVSVKVLVSDWDLLCSGENSRLISEGRKEVRCEENTIITNVTFDLCKAVNYTACYHCPSTHCCQTASLRTAVRIILQL